MLRIPDNAPAPDGPQRTRVRRAVVAVAIIVAIVVGFVVLTNVRGFSTSGNRNRIVHWDGEGSFDPVSGSPAVQAGRGFRNHYVLTSDVVPDGKSCETHACIRKRNKIVKWKFSHSFRKTSGSSSPVLLAEGVHSDDGCGVFNTGTHGENVFGGVVTQAAVHVHGCYEGAKFTVPLANLSHIRVSTDGSAASWSLWHFNGLTSMVKGHGKNCAVTHPKQCWQYVYRRGYFDWSRTLLGLEQHANSWASITVRGNGTYATDRYTS